MPLHQSCFLHLEEKSKKKQHNVFAEHEFKSRPVSCEEPNVKKGDHLRWTGGGLSYYHHSVCKKVDGENITVIEYTGPVLGLLGASQSTSGFSDLGRLGKVIETTISYSKLIEKNAEVIDWPECLRRFKPEKIVHRAETRLGENYYSIINNNCEHFVTWCICNVRVSLQVKSWLVAITEFSHSLMNAKTGALVTANVADEIVPFVRDLLTKHGRKLFLWLDAVIEAGIAVYEIYKVYQGYKEGKYKRKRDAAMDIMWIVAKGSFRFGLVYVGLNCNGKDIIECLCGWVPPFLTSAYQCGAQMAKPLYDWISPYLTYVYDYGAQMVNYVSNNSDKVGGFIEGCVAVSELKKAWNQWQDGVLIRNKREFAIKVIEILSKGSLRFLLGYGGSKQSDKIFAEIGEYLPSLSKLNQSLVCGVVGGSLGHLAGVVITWILENWDYIVNGG